MGRWTGGGGGCPGPKRGVARGVAVYGHPHDPDPDHLHELLGRCEQLRRWARMHGLVLSGIPEDTPRLITVFADAAADH